MPKKEDRRQVGKGNLCGIEWRGWEWGVEMKAISWNVIFRLPLSRSSSHQEDFSNIIGCIKQIMRQKPTHPETSKEVKINVWDSFTHRYRKGRNRKTALAVKIAKYKNPDRHLSNHLIKHPIYQPRAETMVFDLVAAIASLSLCELQYRKVGIYCDWFMVKWRRLR